jgi:hypothetical protein
MSIFTYPVWNGPNNLGVSSITTEAPCNSVDAPGTSLVLRSPTPDTSVALLEVHNNYAHGVSIFTHTAGPLGRGPSINFCSSGGTETAPTATKYNQALMIISASGYDGANYFTASACPYMEFHADEDWSAGHRGSRFEIYTVPKGGTGALPRLCVQSDGSFLFGCPDGSSGPLNNLSMIKPSGTTVGFYLGDNSAGASVTAGNLALSGAAPTVSTGQVGFGSSTSASATVGTNGDVPAQVLGYLIANVGGTNVKIPYYAM